MTENQNPPEIFENPPVKNHVLYFYRLFVKIFCFALFGTGTIVLGILALPLMHIIWLKKKDFQRQARKLVRSLFKFFVFVMSAFGGIEYKIKGREKLKNSGGSVIVANHPSLIDVVMLISEFPNADCIVNASLKKNIVSAVVAYLYITNDHEYEELMSRCKKTIAEGNVLIIFPEGTRSKPWGQNPYKKGAARVSLATDCPIVPIFIGGNDKIGLRKKDSFFLFNHTDKYRYHLYVKDFVYPDEYKDFPHPVAAKKITEKLHEMLCYENNWDKIIGKNPAL